MAITSISGMTAGSAAPQQSLFGEENAEITQYQRAIDRLKQRLQSMSEDDSLTAEEKMEKRQEIQKQINELNQQIRQAKIEARQQKTLGNTMEEMLGGKKEEKSDQKEVLSGKTETDDTDRQSMSSDRMQAMISGGNALEQAKAQNGTARSLEGRARVLAGEIQMDQSRGRDTEEKEAEQAALEQRSNEVRAKAAGKMGDVTDRFEEILEREEEEKKDPLKKEPVTPEEEKEDRIERYPNIDLLL